MTPNVLVVDDDESICRLVAAVLAERGFDPRTVPSASAALGALASDEIDVLLADVIMDDMDGISLCARVHEERPDLPVVLMTASRDLDTAIDAIRAGAYDYVTKPLDPALLERVLTRASRRHELWSDPARLGRAVREGGLFETLLGTSQPMQRLYRLLPRIAASDSSVLIAGESGTGKELVARALHARSNRRGGPFVALNCAAIPESLLESELFGHARGAFTDAHCERAGLFVQSSGGTLFLDEIADLPLPLQPKLLRALQERRVRPVGAATEIGFDARFIAATNRDLREEVGRGRFREDLYFRLAVIQVDLPPLRRREDDVLLLAQRFLERYAASADKRVLGLTPAVTERLRVYPWPGNVRELENCIERAVALTHHERVCVDDLPPHVRVATLATSPDGRDDAVTLAPLSEIERRHVVSVLEAVGRNASRAARILGIDRKTLARRLRRYGVRRRGRA